MSEPIEINSLEFHSILIDEKEPEEKFADYDRIIHDDGTRFPMMVKIKKSGKVFLIDDTPPKTTRKRPIEELRNL